MEDLDRPRVVPGCAADILRALEAFGLWWDGEIEYQSRRTELYEQALATLGARGLTFACSCSRRSRAAPYPGTCRNGPARPGPTALRFRVDGEATVRFEDRIQGLCEFALRELGDVVVRRRDGVHAYQLAVVVDDAAQGVTSAVRGADLLASTAWQIALSQALSLPVLSYAHLPVVVEPDGAKLAKSRRSVPVDPLDPGAWLIRALELLRQDPPAELAHEPPSSVLRWAIDHWKIGRLSRIRTVPARSS
jgi:glutamyl-Q tRNA(Asp) synthetase